MLQLGSWITEVWIRETDEPGPMRISQAADQTGILRSRSSHRGPPAAIHERCHRDVHHINRRRAQ